MTTLNQEQIAYINGCATLQRAIWRLAQQDPYMLEKRKVLEQLYTPTFKPNLNVDKTKPKKDEEKENDDDDDSEKHLEEKGIKNLESQYISDDNIQELYRNALFQNRKFNINRAQRSD